MKFSLLSLLIITSLLAVGAAVYDNMIKIDANQTEIAELEPKIELLESQVYLPNEALEIELKQLPAYIAELKTTTERVSNAATKLREKYFRVTPKGDDVVSIRLSGMPKAGPYKGYRVYRVRVPKSRNVWLNFSVQKYVYHADADTRQNDTFKRTRLAWKQNEKTYLTESLTDVSMKQKVPMQIRLSPGKHEIQILATRDDKFRNGPNDWNRLTIKLDGQTLLVTQNRANDNNYEFRILEAFKQKNFGPKKKLPFLLKQCFVSEDNFEPNRKRDATVWRDFIGTVWLSDKDSGAGEFPGE